MKILLLEYISGGGLIKESIPHSLAREGDLILQALLDDLTEIEGIRVSVMRDARLKPLRMQSRRFSPEAIRVSLDHEFDAVWKAGIRSVDAVWPIAPESGGVLERLCRDVRECGKILVNSPAEVVALTASKYNTLMHLKNFGIEVVPTIPLAEFRDQFSGAWVIKPDDRAGCGGIRIVRNNPDLRRLQAASPPSNAIIQPFMEGTAMSLSVLFKQGDARLLSCNRQHINLRDDYFSLSGCTVNVAPGDPVIFSELACAIAHAIPDLFGYAGVDLILVEGRPKVLEINPRLTTSYAGLSRAINQNVAARVLDLLAIGSRLPDKIEYAGFSLDIKLGESHDP